MAIIQFLTSPLALDIFFKLLIAVVLSAFIGVERELIHKPAGIKTHTLICISSTLIMSLGIYMYEKFGIDKIDPSRLPAQILTGIGFVGAGTIIRDGFSVKGITTAASLLCITCIGLAIGAGFYEGAIFATIFIFLILCLTNPLQNLIDNNKKYVLFTITVHSKNGMISKIQNIFEDNNIPVVNIKQINDEVSQYTLLKFLVKCTDKKLKETLINDLCSIDDVKEVYTSKKSYQHDSE